MADGASTERPTMKVVGCFRSFSHFLKQLTPSLFDAHDKAPNDSKQGQTIARQPTRRPKWQHTGSNANPVDEMTTQQVERPTRQPSRWNDKLAGQTPTQWTKWQTNRPDDNHTKETTTQQLSHQPNGQNNKPAGQTTTQWTKRQNSRQDDQPTDEMTKQ